ncbi:het domain protein [Colletotrichum truncatum]|uniref:Het domain protein n=1 Tax=Colletotrichum truncatum TaxID=5467 RepID=A0ACC3Z6M4_COLTU|nr:het domain protein [Colletotrichum truncatum]KAF6787984.1 het domain protein [Colletotrichum truncatum]
MWLINTETLQLEEIEDPSATVYAILSHTWGEEEVTFKDISCLSKAEKKKGFVKIAKTCEIARRKDLKYAWVDTCCIDKTSSAELSEAINSMFPWYQRSAVCIVYLADLAPSASTQDPETPSSPSTAPPSSKTDSLHDLSDLGSCRWFSRGWTLQELIAPANVEFYDVDWQFRFTKEEVASKLSSITQIDVGVLRMTKPLKSVLVAVKMSWASKRQTRRPEDIAYCLLGIFDINMPMLYGEGSKAFLRLQEQIATQSDDASLFSWHSTDASQVYRGVFAKSPMEFAGCSGVKLGNRSMFAKPEFSLTNKGVRFHVSSYQCEDDTSTVMPLGLQNDCPTCLERHDVLVLLVSTAKGCVRTSSERCCPWPAGERNQDKDIYTCKQVDPLESAALEQLVRRPLRLSYRFDPGALKSIDPYPTDFWDFGFYGYSGDAFSEDFTGYINVYAEFKEPLVLAMLIFKIAGQDPDVEIYAVPISDEKIWEVAEDSSFRALYGQGRIEIDGLFAKYKLAKESGEYQPKANVKVQRLGEPDGRPRSVMFDAVVEEGPRIVLHQNCEYDSEDSGDAKDWEDVHSDSANSEFGGSQIARS